MPKSGLIVWKFLKKKSVKDYCLSQVVLGGSWMVLGGYCGWKSVRNFENPRTMSQHKNLASQAPQRLNKEWNMSISKKFDWISVYFSWIDNISDGSWRFLVVLGVFAQKQGVCRNIALPLKQWTTIHNRNILVKNIKSILISVPKTYPDEVVKVGILKTSCCLWFENVLQLRS